MLVCEERECWRNLQEHQIHSNTGFLWISCFSMFIGNLICFLHLCLTMCPVLSNQLTLHTPAVNICTAVMTLESTSGSTGGGVITSLYPGPIPYRATTSMNLCARLTLTHGECCENNANPCEPENGVLMYHMPRCFGGPCEAYPIKSHFEVYLNPITRIFTVHWFLNVYHLRTELHQPQAH